MATAAVDPKQYLDIHDQITKAVWSPNAAVIAATSVTKALVYVFDATTFRVFYTLGERPLGEFPDDVKKIVWSPCGKCIAVHTGRDYVYVHSIEERKKISSFTTRIHGGIQMFSFTSKLDLICILPNGQIHIVDIINQNTCLRTFEIFPGSPVDCNSVHNTIAVCQDGVVYFKNAYDVLQLSALEKYHLPFTVSYPRSIHVSPDNNKLLVLFNGPTKMFGIWNTSKSITKIFSYSPEFVCFSPNSMFFAIAFQAKIIFFSAETAEKLTETESPYRITGLSWDSLSTHLLVSCKRDVLMFRVLEYVGNDKEPRFLIEHPTCVVPIIACLAAKHQITSNTTPNTTLERVLSTVQAIEQRLGNVEKALERMHVCIHDECAGHGCAHS